MSTLTQKHQAPGKDSSKMLKAMVGIGILCGLMIVLTYEGTLPAIEANRAEALEKAIFKVIPGTEKTQAFLWSEGKGFTAIEGENKSVGERIYAGYNASGQLTGLAIPCSGQGYADAIRILYGYQPDNQAILGFYVLESKETPGLGDKIEKDPAFLANFESLTVSLNENGTAVAHPIVPVKAGEKSKPWEFDCISGATISSRAVGDMLSASTAFWAPLIEKNLTDFYLENK